MTITDSLEQSLWARKYKKTKKHNVICYLAFVGTNYKGFQLLSINDNQTVEGHLYRAFCCAGAVFHKNIERLQKIAWRRSSRTDKGVHSLGSVVSLKIQNPFPTYEALKDSMNKFLPLDIRVLSIQKDSKKFNCYLSCSGRTYSYVCPSSVFSVYSDDSVPFRISPQEVTRINTILFQFCGTHFFHNFTSKNKPTDQNTSYFQRLIRSFYVAEVFSYKGDEFLRLKVNGQSFIYNQIRKMVSFVIFSMRGTHLKDFSLDAVTDINSQVFIPKAPASGLYLERVDFYEKGKDKKGFHEQCQKRLMPHASRFREELLCPEICEKQLGLSEFDEWLKEFEK